MARLAAGVRKRSDGTLEKRFTVSGKRYSVYGKTSKEVTEKETALREQIAKGTYSPNKKVTLDTYFSEWIEARKLILKSSTIYEHKNFYNRHISPALGKVKVQDIEKRQVQQFQKQLLDNLSVSTANNILCELKTILSDAVKDGIIATSPADNVRLARNTGTRATETYHRALTREEQATFVAELQSEYYCELIEFLLYSGARFGEAAALEWSDVDYKNNVIHITKTLTNTEDGKKKSGSPKTRAGKRDIPLTKELKRILIKQRGKTKILSFSDNKIFVSPNGKYAGNERVNAAITRTLKCLDDKGIHIEHFTAHALRDTFATRYIESGGTPQVLKRILGHESFKMTMDLYSHVMDDTIQNEMTNISISV